VSTFHGNEASAAIFVLSKEMLNKVKQDHSNIFDLSKDLVPKFTKKMNVSFVDDVFIDIGTIDNYEMANQIEAKCILKN